MRTIATTVTSHHSKQKHTLPFKNNSPRKSLCCFHSSRFFRHDYSLNAQHVITDYDSFGMRGVQREASSMYKRMSSRDNASMLADGENHSAFLKEDDMDVEGETSNPPWKRSLPHVLVATILSFLFGYHLGVVNEPLESISIDLGFRGNTLHEGLVISTCLAGAFIGSLFSGCIADGIGRCRTFHLCALPMIIGASTSATTKTLAGMLVGRFLVGTGIGLGPPVALVSPAFVRGTYGSFIQIATCLGLRGALFIGIPVKEIGGWWRICFWVSSIPAGILAVAMFCCAESPHWLSKLFLLGQPLFALQQLSGINAVFYFSSTVFKSAGVPSDLANVFVEIVNLSGSLAAMVLTDKLGRKVLLLWSFFGMAVSMGLQVAGASSYVPSTISLYLSVGGMLMFVLTFALGAGPVPGLLLPEIFPSRIRAKAMAVCMSVHWVINFFVGLLFLRMLEQLGPQLLYTICSSFCIMALVVVKRNVMETKGKSLQEIEIALLPQQ